MKNTVREKWLRGEPVLGTITHMKSPVAVEALGAAGLDYVMLDMEHCPTDFNDICTGVTAASASGIAPFVRVCEGTRAAVLRCLDVGSMGIIVPGIDTVDQVKELVQHAKFQPTGNRGYCMTRDGKWGYDNSYAGGLSSYMEVSNAETMLIPQCETVGCLEHIEEVCAIPGVDGILIGPYDLSLAMGIGGQFQNPDFLAAVDRILRACKRNRIMSMIFVGSEADMKLRLEQGFENILYGLDVLSLIQHFSGVSAAFRALP